MFVNDNCEDNTIDAEDINVPKINKNDLNNMLKQIQNMSTDQRNVFLQNIMKNNNINPNKKEFSSMSRREYQRMRLRKKLEQTNRNSSKKEKKKNNEESEKELLKKKKKTEKNKKRNQRRRLKKKMKKLEEKKST